MGEVPVIVRFEMLGDFLGYFLGEIARDLLGTVGLDCPRVRLPGEAGGAG